MKLNKLLLGAFVLSAGALLAKQPLNVEAGTVAEYNDMSDYSVFFPDSIINHVYYDQNGNAEFEYDPNGTNDS